MTLHQIAVFVYHCRVFSLLVLLLTHLTPSLVSFSCLLIFTFTVYYLSNVFCSVPSEISTVFIETNNTSVNSERNQWVWLLEAKEIGVYGISQYLNCRYWLIASMERSREMSNILVCFVSTCCADKIRLVCCQLVYFTRIVSFFPSIYIFLLLSFMNAHILSMYGHNFHVGNR